MSTYEDVARATQHFLDVQTDVKNARKLLNERLRVAKEQMIDTIHNLDQQSLFEHTPEEGNHGTI